MPRLEKLLHLIGFEPNGDANPRQPGNPHGHWFWRRPVHGLHAVSHDQTAPSILPRARFPPAAGCRSGGRAASDACVQRNSGRNRLALETAKGNRQRVLCGSIEPSLEQPRIPTALLTRSLVQLSQRIQRQYKESKRNETERNKRDVHVCGAISTNTPDFCGQCVLYGKCAQISFR